MEKEIIDNGFKNNNLFKFATKELSQDAVLAWLINWNIYKDNKKLYEKSITFLNYIIKKSKKNINLEEYKIEIIKQFHYIDVFLLLTPKEEFKEKKKYGIIIEDKKLTTIHNNQLEKYKKTIIKNEELEEDCIIKVYYKPYEELYEIEADVIIDRQFMLKEIFNEKIENQIFTDYKEYLEKIERESKDFDVQPIKQWNQNVNLKYIFAKKIKQKENWTDEQIRLANQGGSLFIDLLPKISVPKKYQSFVNNIYLSINANYDNYELRIIGNVNNFNIEKRQKLEDEINILFKNENLMPKKFTHRKGNKTIVLNVIELDPNIIYRDLYKTIKKVENLLNNI